MKLVPAPDSFKENMTAAQAAAAMEAGVRDVLPDTVCVQVPMSDGGEGFVQAVTAAWGAQVVQVDSLDALGRPVRASYGLAEDSLAGDGRAVMDVASCAGLELINPAERDVMASSTAGLGMLLADAARHGAAEVLVGIGGSATTDAGAGMLSALGVRFLDDAGASLRPVPAELTRLAQVDLTGLDPLVAGMCVRVACDVTNPLTGPRGAAAVFGPQKGATPDQVEVLDRVLGRVAAVSGRTRQAALPGAGAAGGLGFALAAFLGASLEPGVELVAGAVGLARAVADADLVLTGEGSVDEQTLEGKTPAGVAAVAAGAGVPCVVCAGRIKPGARVLLEHGVSALVKVGPHDEPLEEALRHGEVNMRRAVAGFLRDWVGHGPGLDRAR